MMRVQDIQDILFAAFPKSWAESWDRPGLVVGNPEQEVTKIACALDASASNILACYKAGANLLVTHHPAYLNPPTIFTDATHANTSAQATIWEAIRCDVALISMHTNLDRSKEAVLMMPSSLGYAATAGLEADRTPGTGSLGALTHLEESMNLSLLAQKCAHTFDTQPTVYGSLSNQIHCIAYFSGSLGDLGHYAIDAGADVIICGECGYHRTLDLLQAGISVITLGHDASEFAFASLLYSTLSQAGIGENHLVLIEESRHWMVVS